MQIDQQMDVILNAVDGKKCGLGILHHACNIPIQLVARREGQCHLPAVGVDDDMVNGCDSTHDESVLDSKNTKKMNSSKYRDSLM